MGLKWQSTRRPALAPLRSPEAHYRCRSYPYLSLHDSVYNGLTPVPAPWANPDNELPALIREFTAQGRVHFAHIRNVKRHSSRDFDECAHLSSHGDLDMFAIVKAFHDSGFNGYIRPDHGRMIWGEKARPGYGLYDRALGASYLLGLWEAIAKMKHN